MRDIISVKDSVRCIMVRDVINTFEGSSFDAYVRSVRSPCNVFSEWVRSSRQVFSSPHEKRGRALRITCQEANKSM